MIASLRDAATSLEAMRTAGVQLDPPGGTSDDYAILFTYDPDVARKYGFHPEEDFLDDEEHESEGEEHGQAPARTDEKK
jgi:hypothetical protein